MKNDNAIQCLPSDTEGNVVDIKATLQFPIEYLACGDGGALTNFVANKLFDVMKPQIIPYLTFSAIENPRQMMQTITAKLSILVERNDV